VKPEREEMANSPEKLPPIAIPSPKITFHNEPKIESPRFSLLGDSIKKKFTQDPQVRKPSEDLEKKSVIDKIVSPSISLKSPLVLHKTPLQNAPSAHPEAIRRQELENFLLPRKLSEDRPLGGKREKAREEGTDKRGD
jgi:hypothetical protein